MPDYVFGGIRGTLRVSLRKSNHWLNARWPYSKSPLHKRSSPTVGARLALDRVLRYLRCTSDFRIEGVRQESDVVQYYSDSDHAGDRGVTKFSRTGTVILLNSVPVHWRSVLQTRGIAVSSAVAEIYALYDTLKESQLYTWRCQEMGMNVNNPILIKVDNKQAESFTNSTCANSRLRGTIDLREAWVKELKDSDKVSVEYISTRANVADLLTKAMREGRHKELLKLLGGRERGDGD